MNDGGRAPHGRIWDSEQMQPPNLTFGFGDRISNPDVPICDFSYG